MFSVGEMQFLMTDLVACMSFFSGVLDKTLIPVAESGILIGVHHVRPVQILVQILAECACDSHDRPRKSTIHGAGYLVRCS